ncbi:uncharacterized protein LOC141830490 [Curcuma longa]|uniref:uncharacterized protein LOC141830490 n=1 Tax=Curcuma longa TaxID=136217 RepID=UPI003D9DD3C6
MGKNKTLHSFFKRKRDEMDSEEQVDASFPQVHESDEVSPIISPSNIDTKSPEKQEEVSNRGEVIFRGIEFLERDPGLRPQIWEYPINQRDEVRRTYLKLGPMQPQLDEYKPSGPPGHKHSNLNKRSGFDVFTVQGYSDWKRVRNGKKCAFLTHVGSSPCSNHNNALRSCQDLLNQSGHVENIINVHTNKEREKNRLRLKVSVAALVKLLAEFNPEVEKVVMENTPVCKHIRDEIGDSKFSIIVDETCDVAKREQMTLKEVLGITDMLCQALQMKAQDIVNAIHMEQTYILRGGHARRQPDHFTNERFFRIEVFLVTIDTQLQELNYKFNEKVMDLLSIMATLVPRNEFRSFNAGEICKMVEKYYPEDFSLQDRYVLENQLNHFVLDISQDAELRKIGTITELCRCLVETSRHTAYNFVDRLLRLLVTLPVSTTNAKQAFSTLKIIKIRLRSKMEDEFLSNSLLVYIEGGIAEKYL